MQHDGNRAARGRQSNLAGAGYFFARLDAGDSKSESFVQELTVTGSGARITRVAEHPHPVANHRNEAFDARKQLGLFDTRSGGELGRRSGETLAHQLDCALEIFALGPAGAGFAPRFL